MRNIFRPIEQQIRREQQLAGRLSLVRFFCGKEMNEMPTTPDA